MHDVHCQCNTASHIKTLACTRTGRCREDVDPVSWLGDGASCGQRSVSIANSGVDSGDTIVDGYGLVKRSKDQAWEPWCGFYCWDKHSQSNLQPMEPVIIAVCTGAGGKCKCRTDPGRQRRITYKY